ncbi:MAG: CHAT domain-containing protein [Deltaproteobacteria bacterium]|nr:MAG: CHAT domain-containing protein [Deltaproteobacteria bacterium]
MLDDNSNSVSHLDVVGADVRKAHIILMLNASPLCEHRLALDLEARAIEQELVKSPHRDRFSLVTCWAVEPLDLLTGLRRHRPTVVHFSGHGVQRTSRRTAAVLRDVSEQPSSHGSRSGGLCFQQPVGGVQIVSPDALKDTFRAVGASVRLVVLNACYTEVQAHALRTHVDCVIGTRGSIQDDAAIRRWCVDRQRLSPGPRRDQLERPPRSRSAAAQGPGRD